MPVFEKSTLLQQLQQDVNDIISRTHVLSAADPVLLNRQPAPDAWSVAQVWAHLNFYNDIYLPRLEEKIKATNGTGHAFKTGWLGNYFTEMMAPKVEGVPVNKMSAPPNARPEAALDAPQVIETFLAGEQHLLRLLEQAAHANLDSRVRTGISSLIRLKVGDTLRFLIAHQQRHLLQAERTLLQVQ